MSIVLPENFALLLLVWLPSYGPDLDLQARHLGVLNTSNRKPRCRIPLRRAAEILTHPGQVEVVSSKRVDVLAHERSNVAQRFVVNLMAFGTYVGHDCVHVNHVPGDHGIMQDR
jgi:hypothetical protein